MQPLKRQAATQRPPTDGYQIKRQSPQRNRLRARNSISASTSRRNGPKARIIDIARVIPGSGRFRNFFGIASRLPTGAGHTLPLVAIRIVKHRPTKVLSLWDHTRPHAAKPLITLLVL
jgi:hypothetical protein